VNRRVLAVYKRVMALPEGLPWREYRREMRRYIREMSEEEKQDILDRQDEIDENSQESYEANESIFLELGFTQGETNVFARCRINSPGIRQIIAERVAITRYATPEQIRMISEGDGSVLTALKLLHGKGE